jgi:hypothetical protein
MRTVLRPSTGGNNRFRYLPNLFGFQEWRLRTFLANLVARNNHRSREMEVGYITKLLSL